MFFLQMLKFQKHFFAKNGCFIAKFDVFSSDFQKKFFFPYLMFLVEFELFQKKYFFCQKYMFFGQIRSFFCETEYLSWRTFVWNLSVLWTTEEVTPQYWNYICSGWGYIWHNNSITDKVMKWYWQGYVWHDSTSETTT